MWFYRITGLAERWDFGAESPCGVQQEAGELGFVAEWRGDHPMVSEPRRMSRTGQITRPVWVGHGMGKARRAGQGGMGETGVCSEFQRGLS